MTTRWGWNGRPRIGAAWWMWLLVACAEVPEPEDAGFDAPEVPIDVGHDVPVIGGPFALEVGALELSVRRGETVIVPVRVLRIPGFDARVTISADGLPEGTSARAVRDGDDALATELAITASEDAEAVEGSPFVISASGAGHRRTWRATIDVLPR